LNFLKELTLFINQNPNFPQSIGFDSKLKTLVDDLKLSDHGPFLFKLPSDSFFKLKGIHHHEWNVLISYYLDLKVGESKNPLRNRQSNSDRFIYWPLQQVFEEYLLAKRNGSAEHLVIATYPGIKSMIVRAIIDQCELTKDLIELEHFLHEGLLSNYLSESKISNCRNSEITRCILNSTSTNSKYINIYEGLNSWLFSSTEQHMPIQYFLNWIYFECLKNKVEKYSYGDDWLIMNLDTMELIYPSEFNPNNEFYMSPFNGKNLLIILKECDRKSWF
jgi:hypothetical protein